MLETFLAYLIILAPTIISIIGGLLVDYFRKRGIDKAMAVVDEARAKFNEFTNSNDVKQLIAQNKTLIQEIKEAKKAETLAVEELTRIHKLHPEWIEEKED